MPMKLENKCCQDTFNAIIISSAALKTPPIEESVLGIPASAQKRHFNLASKLVKVLTLFNQ